MKDFPSPSLTPVPILDYKALYAEVDFSTFVSGAPHHRHPPFRRMKNCLACGHENPDTAAHCQTCDTRAFVSSSPEAAGGHIISPDEKLFWDRMGFCQFAVVVIRVGTLWYLFRTILVATYLPNYFRISGGAVSPFAAYELKAYLFLFRIAFSLGALLALFRFAPNIVNWLANHFTATATATPPSTGHSGGGN